MHCMTDENSGVWIFTRTPGDQDGIKKGLEVLKEKGYSTSRLVDVPQEGCERKGAFIKPDLKK